MLISGAWELASMASEPVSGAAALEASSAASVGVASENTVSAGWRSAMAGAGFASDVGFAFCTGVSSAGTVPAESRSAKMGKGRPSVAEFALREGVSAFATIFTGTGATGRLTSVVFFPLIRLARVLDRSPTATTTALPSRFRENGAFPPERSSTTRVLSGWRPMRTRAISELETGISFFPVTSTTPQRSTTRRLG